MDRLLSGLSEIGGKRITVAAGGDGRIHFLSDVATNYANFINFSLSTFLWHTEIGLALYLFRYDNTVQ